MVVGVTDGYRKSLEITGVGYRAAKVGEKLVSTRFPSSITRGFAPVGERNVAVCLLPGTELAFEKEVERDTRKLDSFEAFERNTSDVTPKASGAPPGGRGFGGGMNLRSFAEQRQKYLLAATRKKE